MAANVPGSGLPVSGHKPAEDQRSGGGDHDPAVDAVTGKYLLQFMPAA